MSSASSPSLDPLSPLLAAVAGGDEGALRGLYDHTRRRLFGLLQRILGERGTAEDVLAEVYIQAWRHARSFDPQRGTGWRWLITIARRRAIDRLREGAAASARTVAEDLAAIDPIDPGPTPQESALGVESSERVRVAVGHLPVEQRQVLEASFLGGRSHTEVAEDLDLPLGTVKSRIRAGLEALRRSLGSAHLEEEGAA